MPPLEPFTHFIAIDWSARNKPSPALPSRNAIWYCEATATGRLTTKYFRTRYACVDHLEKRLGRLLRQGRRVLVGWDFSFGYPKGLARALRLKGKPAWRAVWEKITDLIEDGKDNQNNRFAVGAELNRLTNAPAGPFWGIPPGDSGIYLGPKRDFPYPVPTKKVLLAERRLVEHHHGKMQPAWKLAYAGSVGGQSLTGIPLLHRLRFETEGLRGQSAIWPFESLPGYGPCAVHAEIYPSLVERPGRDRIPDREQVRTYVRWLQSRQEGGLLSELLAVPYELDKKRRKQVRNHEGWVLGITGG